MGYTIIIRFLSIITPYLIPFGDTWQKMYIVNGVLRLAFGFLIFTVIWNKRGLIWYFLSIGLTLLWFTIYLVAQIWIILLKLRVEEQCAFFGLCY